MLELKNLAVGYGEQKVLQGLSASFSRGQLIGVIGTNGCGKSTLLKTVVGILKQAEGEILLNGAQIQSMSSGERSRQIAYLPQERVIPSMTVSQMVLHGRFPYLGSFGRYSASDKQKANNAMERMGLMDLRDTPISNLSGGIRQKAYLAMALAQDTDYILLDEPTTYLDIAHRIELMQILKELSKDGKGIVAVMHDLPLAFTFSDEVAVMGDGKILAKDTARRVSEMPILRELFGVSVQSDANGTQYSYRFF